MNSFVKQLVLLVLVQLRNPLGGVRGFP